MRQARRTRIPLSLLLAVAAGLAAASLTACRRSADASPSLGRKPHIVLISIDTLRGDYFCPEYMPQTYGWAKDNALIYTNAYSTSTWTRPSYVTLLTGLSQEEHGVEYRDSILPPDIPTLPEKLGEMGYFTCAFTNAGHVSKEVGLDRGFDSWFQVRNDPVPNYFELMFTPFQESRKKLATLGREPVFCLVHTYYVHEWFLDPADHESPETLTLQEWNKYRVARAHELAKREYADEMTDEYGRKVLEFDALLYDYIQWLLASPLADNLCIILTSDHGEALYETYGTKVLFGHSGRPYVEKLRIPLMIYGFGAGETDELIGLTDLFSMVQEIARDSAVRPRYHTIIEAHHLTQDRSAEHKIRSTARISADGGFVVRESPGASWGDEDTPELMTPERIRELRSLGYLN
jgi:arylsulfatase A-like enzyme